MKSKLGEYYYLKCLSELTRIPKSTIGQFIVHAKIFSGESVIEELEFDSITDLQTYLFSQKILFDQKDLWINLSSFEEYGTLFLPKFSFSNLDIDTIEKNRLVFLCIFSNSSCLNIGFHYKEFKLNLIVLESQSK